MSIDHWERFVVIHFVNVLDHSNIVMEKFVTVISYFLLFYFIFNVSQEIFKQSDFNKFDTEGNPTLENFLRSYKKSLNKSEAKIKEEFANSLTSFRDLFGEVCEFWQRPYFQSHENCRDDYPCQIFEWIISIKKDLEKQDDLEEIIEVFGNKLTEDTFIRVAKYYVIREISNDYLLPKINDMDQKGLNRLKLKSALFDNELKTNVILVVNEILRFYFTYGNCLNFESAKEFYENHGNFKVSADKDKYQRVVDSANELNQIATDFKDVVMDLVILLSAEKSKIDEKAQSAPLIFPLNYMNIMLLKLQVILTLLCYLIPQIPFLCFLTCKTFIPNTVHLVRFGCYRLFRELITGAQTLLYSIVMGNEQEKPRYVYKRRRKRNRP